MAENGFFAVVPDFFKGNPWKPERGNMASSEFFEWFALWKDSKQEEIDEDFKVVERYLREDKKFSKVGVVGVSWGGLSAIRQMWRGNIDVGVSMHGILVSPDSATRCKGPVLYICSELDKFVTFTVLKKTKKAIDYHSKKIDAEFQFFKTVAHGFANSDFL